MVGYRSKTNDSAQERISQRHFVWYTENACRCREFVSVNREQLKVGWYQSEFVQTGVDSYTNQSINLEMYATCHVKVPEIAQKLLMSQFVAYFMAKDNDPLSEVVFPLNYTYRETYSSARKQRELTRN